MLKRLLTAFLIISAFSLVVHFELQLFTSQIDFLIKLDSEFLVKEANAQISAETEGDVFCKSRLSGTISKDTCFKACPGGAASCVFSNTHPAQYNEELNEDLDCYVCDPFVSCNDYGLLYSFPDCWFSCEIDPKKECVKSLGGGAPGIPSVSLPSDSDGTQCWTCKDREDTCKDKWPDTTWKSECQRTCLKPNKCVMVGNNPVDGLDCYKCQKFVPPPPPDKCKDFGLIEKAECKTCPPAKPVCNQVIIPIFGKIVKDSKGNPCYDCYPKPKTCEEQGLRTACAADETCNKVAAPNGLACCTCVKKPKTCKDWGLKTPPCKCEKDELVIDTKRNDGKGNTINCCLCAMNYCHPDMNLLKCLRECPKKGGKCRARTAERGKPRCYVCVVQDAEKKTCEDHNMASSCTPNPCYEGEKCVMQDPLAPPGSGPGAKKAGFQCAGCEAKDWDPPPCHEHEMLPSCAPCYQASMACKWKKMGTDPEYYCAKCLPPVDERCTDGLLQGECFKDTCADGTPCTTVAKNCHLCGVVKCPRNYKPGDCSGNPCDKGFKCMPTSGPCYQCIPDSCEHEGAMECIACSTHCENDKTKYCEPAPFAKGGQDCCFCKQKPAQTCPANSVSCDTECPDGTVLGPPLTAESFFDVFIEVEIKGPSCCECIPAEPLGCPPGAAPCGESCSDGTPALDEVETELVQMDLVGKGPFGEEIKLVPEAKCCECVSGEEDEEEEKCKVDSDCDDGLFCNGEEKCNEDGECVEGTNPCTGDTECNEQEDYCEPKCSESGVYKDSNCSGQCKDYERCVDIVMPGDSQGCFRCAEKNIVEECTDGLIEGPCPSGGKCADGSDCRTVGQNCHSCQSQTQPPQGDCAAVPGSTTDKSCNGQCSSSECKCYKVGSILTRTECCRCEPARDEDDETECAVDEDCDDAVFCNGYERCNEDGECVDGDDPCADDEECNEDTQDCGSDDQDTCASVTGGNLTSSSNCNGECPQEQCHVVSGPRAPTMLPGENCYECVDAEEGGDDETECKVDSDCDDAVFCNGLEACNEDGECVDGDNPCPDNEECNEETTSCEGDPKCTAPYKPGNCPSTCTKEDGWECLEKKVEGQQCHYCRSEGVNCSDGWYQGVCKVETCSAVEMCVAKGYCYQCRPGTAVNQCQKADLFPGDCPGQCSSKEKCVPAMADSEACHTCVPKKKIAKECKDLKLTPGGCSPSPCKSNEICKDTIVDGFRCYSCTPRPTTGGEGDGGGITVGEDPVTEEKCETDDDCSDGKWCTGEEKCNEDGECMPGNDPCPGEECNEMARMCQKCPWGSWEDSTCGGICHEDAKCIQVYYKPGCYWCVPKDWQPPKCDPPSSIGPCPNSGRCQDGSTCTSAGDGRCHVCSSGVVEEPGDGITTGGDGGVTQKKTCQDMGYEGDYDECTASCLGGKCRKGGRDSFDKPCWECIRRLAPLSQFCQLLYILYPLCICFSKRHY